LTDLIKLLEESKHWNKPQPLPKEVEEEKKSSNGDDEEGVLVAKGTGGAASGDVEKSGPSGPAPPVKDHPEFSKYFKLLKSGTPLDEVKETMKQDGKNPSIADLDPEKSLSSQRPSMADQEVQTAPNAVENAQKKLQEALMRKKQGPKVTVLIPMRNEANDDDAEEHQNPQARLMAALAKGKPSEGDNEDRPLRTDPEYAKYFKMLKMGMSKEQIQHAMRRDEKDPTIIELDPERSLLAQRPPPQKAESSPDGPPLIEDPDYAKYFKMLKMGMPKAQVAHAMTRDTKDASVLDLDPNKSLKSQQAKDDGPDLKDDPEFKKYFNMLKLGMGKEQVAHALQRDGKDIKILDLDPSKSLASQQRREDAKDTGPPLKDDEDYKKYFKMLTMGMTKEQVVHAVQRDGKDPAVLNMDPDRSLASQQAGTAGGAFEGPPLKEDPEFVKYFKMLNMGLPKDAVKNALARDGKDPSILDLDPEKSLKSQTGRGGEDEKDNGVPLKDDPEYSKYFKMLNMGLPKDAVKNAVARDGKDPTVMDLDPSRSVEFQMKKTSGGSIRRTPSKKKKKVRRKKIYWTPINPEQIKEDSIWNLVKGSVRMEKLDYDVKEFEDLFTESADPADRKENKRKKSDSNTQKKSVQVIDGKRSMNGGIILARMKVEYTVIAKAVDEM
jgi:Formin Homology 2 Domain/Subunit CCDC53 of WASH complex